MLLFNSFIQFTHTHIIHNISHLPPSILSETTKSNQVKMKFDQTGNTNMEEIVVNPPDSLVKYETPLFVGIEPSSVNQEEMKAKGNLNNTKLDDMVDSIIPARWVQSSVQYKTVQYRTVESLQFRVQSSNRHAHIHSFFFVVFCCCFHYWFTLCWRNFSFILSFIFINISRCNISLLSIVYIYSLFICFFSCVYICYVHV